MIKGRGPGREEPPAPPDRREAPRIATRHHLRVNFNLSVLEPRRAGGTGGEAVPMVLEGHTHDVSATGLALVVPTLSLGGRDLSRPGQAFLVEIELSTGPLRFQATVARHDRLETGGEEGYVLGVRITEISESNHARLTHFLREARQ